MAMPWSWIHSSSIKIGLFQPYPQPSGTWFWRYKDRPSKFDTWSNTDQAIVHWGAVASKKQLGRHAKQKNSIKQDAQWDE